MRSNRVSLLRNEYITHLVFLNLGQLRVVLGVAKPLFRGLPGFRICSTDELNT